MASDYPDSPERYCEGDPGPVEIEYNRMAEKEAEWVISVALNILWLGALVLVLLGIWWVLQP